MITTCSNSQVLQRAVRRMICRDDRKSPPSEGGRTALIVAGAVVAGCRDFVEELDRHDWKTFVRGGR